MAVRDDHTPPRTNRCYESRSGCLRLFAQSKEPGFHPSGKLLLNRFIADPGNDVVGKAEGHEMPRRLFTNAAGP